MCETDPVSHRLTPAVCAWASEVPTRSLRFGEGAVDSGLKCHIDCSFVAGNDWHDIDGRPEAMVLTIDQLLVLHLNLSLSSIRGQEAALGDEARPVRFFQLLQQQVGLVGLENLLE
jgi:hypothetical protein